MLVRSGLALETEPSVETFSAMATGPVNRALVVFVIRTLTVPAAPLTAAAGDVPTKVADRGEAARSVAEEVEPEPVEVEVEEDPEAPL